MLPRWVQITAGFHFHTYIPVTTLPIWLWVILFITAHTILRYTYNVPAYLLSSIYFTFYIKFTVLLYSHSLDMSTYLPTRNSRADKVVRSVGCREKGGEFPQGELLLKYEVSRTAPQINEPTSNALRTTNSHRWPFLYLLCLIISR